MSFTTGRIGFGLLFALNSLAALGQTPPMNELKETRQEVEQLKQEYDQMKQAYEERFKKLDERLNQLETANSGPTGVAYTAAVSAPKPATKVTAVATTPAAAGQEASGSEAHRFDATVSCRAGK
jgi:flagellar capping protein FliD